MLCYPFEEKRLLQWNPPFIVQPKLDGERCRAIIKHGDIVLLSSEENIINSVPHINKALEMFTGMSHIELDGELYVHNSSFNDIHSVVGRTKNLHPLHQEMQYYVFDIVQESTPQGVRLRALRQLDLHKLEHIHLVESRLAHNLDDVLYYYDKFVEQGYEGIIVRNLFNLYIRRRSIFMMKFKPKKSDVYRVIGYKEEIDKNGKPKGRLGSLICSSENEAEFSVGSGLTDEQRASYWDIRDKLCEYDCQVQYQHINSDTKSPRFPVFISLIKRVEEPKEENPFL